LPLPLLSDDVEQVRAAAAKALTAADDRSPAVLAALVAALDRPGEAARRTVCQALETRTGRTGPYDPQADDAARRATLQAWKDWWAHNRPK